MNALIRQTFLLLFLLSGLVHASLGIFVTDNFDKAAKDLKVDNGKLRGQLGDAWLSISAVTLICIIVYFLIGGFLLLIRKGAWGKTSFEQSFWFSVTMSMIVLFTSAIINIYSIDTWEKRVDENEITANCDLTNPSPTSSCGHLRGNIGTTLVAINSASIALSGLTLILWVMGNASNIKRKGKRKLTYPTLDVNNRLKDWKL